MTPVIIPRTRGPHLRAFLNRHGVSISQAAGAVPGISQTSVGDFCRQKRSMTRLNLIRVMGAALNIAAYRDELRQRAIARQAFAEDRGAE